MRVDIDVPEYSLPEGFRFDWEDDFAITVQAQNGEVTIAANRAGLI